MTDKRTPQTDALDTLGFIIDHTAQRDAIHLAVEPVVAGEWMIPGQNVVIEDGKAVSAKVGAGVGIVDPFLMKPVKPGERFWLVLMPRTIRSLRHVWEHPAFPKGYARSKTEAEAWLKEFCEGNISYEHLISGILLGEIEVDDTAVHVSGFDAHGDIPPEFWDHFETVTGMEPKHRPTYFSCSC